jgi:hypothetical protein
MRNYTFSLVSMETDFIQNKKNKLKLKIKDKIWKNELKSN